MKAELLDVGLYQKYLEDEGLADLTVRGYVFIINNFLVTNPNIDEIDDYNNYLVEHSIRKRNYKAYHALRKFILFKIEDVALKRKLVKNLIKVSMQEPERQSKYLDNKDREKVINQISDERHRLIAMIQNETGARASDILYLKKGSINFEMYQKSLALRLDIIGKGKKKNTKYIFNKKVQDSILEFISEKNIDKEFYFVDRTRCYESNQDNVTTIIKTNYSWYLQDIKEACIKAGIDQKLWATHDFRRSVARDVYGITDKDIEQLKKFMGHSRIDTTLRYLKQSGLDTIDTSKLLAKSQGKI